MSDPNANHPPHSDYDEKVSVVSEHAPASVRREKPDPRTGSEPLSLWTFFLAAMVLLVGGGFLGKNGGNLFGSMSQYTITGYTPMKAPPRGDVEDKRPWIVKWTDSGKKEFNNTCASCHQTTGKGQAGLYPPLAGSEYVVGGTDRLANILINGLQGPVTVAGSSFNNVMQPWEALSTEKLAQIMTYIRRSWGNDAKLPQGEDGVVTKEMLASVFEKYKPRAVCTAADIAQDTGNLQGAKVDPQTGEPAGGAAPAPAPAAPPTK